MNGKIICRAKFGRGTGLGNRLFPWARCKVFAHLHPDVQMITPIWMRLAIGQLLRGGVDYGNYHKQLILFGLFQREISELGLIRGFLETKDAKSIDEPDKLDNPLQDLSDGSKVLITFKGWKTFFEKLNGWNDFLLQELRNSTRKKYLKMVDNISDVPIGICVRCGNDFKEPTNTDYQPIGPLDKTPLKWYINCLQLIRKSVGYNAHAYVVSDGTRKQLHELLEMDNVTFVRPGSAITDLLILSKANVLLVPGASSFAAWASYFGQMPTISHPGQPVASTWRIIPQKGQFIGELNPDNPDVLFLDQIKNMKL
ncbi:MAG: hypothetical protein KBG22_12195 [Smithella sp.]|nr:hypothetical protein [Smithella sp.]